MGGIVEPRENDTRTVTRERGTLIAVTVCSRVFLRLASLATRKEDLARRLTKSLLAFEQKKSRLKLLQVMYTLATRSPHFLRLSKACATGGVYRAWLLYGC